jgi:hypothetical protein
LLHEFAVSGGRQINLRSLVDIPSSARARRRLVGGAGTLLLLCASACGASSTASPSAGAPTGGAASSSAASTAAASGTHEFTATLKVTGTVTQSATFTQSLSILPACAALAKSGMANQTSSIPQSLSNQNFSLNWNITPYNGPGTYTDATDFQDSVDLNAPYQGTTDQFDQVSGTTLSITVNSNGSGSATFSNLQDGDQLPVAGSETWTCS